MKASISGDRVPVPIMQILIYARRDSSYDKIIMEVDIHNTHMDITCSLRNRTYTSTDKALPTSKMADCQQIEESIYTFTTMSSQSTYVTTSSSNALNYRRHQF